MRLREDKPRLSCEQAFIVLGRLICLPIAYLGPAIMRLQPTTPPAADRFPVAAVIQIKSGLVCYGNNLRNTADSMGDFHDVAH